MTNVDQLYIVTFLHFLYILSFHEMAMSLLSVIYVYFKSPINSSDIKIFYCTSVLGLYDVRAFISSGLTILTTSNLYGLVIYVRSSKDGLDKAAVYVHHL